jgi:uncharacterized protein YjbI with pentapeptide repeats
LTAIPVSAAGSTTYRDCSQITVAAGADLHRCDLADSTIIGLDLNAINVAWSDLSRVNGGCDPDLPRTNLNGAIAYRALFVDAKLCDAILTDADLHGSDLSGAALEDASVNRANLAWADLDGAGAAFAPFDDANLGNVSWRNGFANGASFDGADLHRIDFRGTDLRSASFVGTDLRYARLDRGRPERRRSDRCERAQLDRDVVRDVLEYHVPGRHEQRHEYRRDLRRSLTGADRWVVESRPSRPRVAVARRRAPRPHAWERSLRARHTTPAPHRRTPRP